MFLFDVASKFCDVFTPFQAAVATSLLIFYFVFLFLRDNELPPGPIGIPFFGYWPFLKAETCHCQLKDMVPTYGDVFSFRAFGRLFVHLGSIKAIKAAHITKGDCFASRPERSVFEFMFQDGLVVLNGEPWKVLRKFFVMKFKEYSMSAAKDTTGSIQDELKATVEELQKTEGQPVVITDLVTQKIQSIMRKILFNDEGISEEDMQKLIDEYNTMMSGIKSTTFFLYGNFAKYLVFPFLPGSWRATSSVKRINKILLKMIQTHKNKFDERHISDIVDCFIQERNQRIKKGEPTAEKLTDLALASSLNQIIFDGVLTAGLFVSTFLLSLVEYPEEQDKIYNEIIEVIGPDRQPTIEDKSKLPYTNAFMYEVMRLSDLFPLFPSLECTKDTEVQGLKIPKGSITLLNFYAAQRDPKIFEDPETFHPSRYLPEPGKPRPDLPIMFGVGKRSCIGEGFTTIQAFLFLTTIVKSFKLSFPEGCYSPSNMFWSQEKLQIRATVRT